MVKEGGDAVLKADLAYTVKTGAVTVRIEADTKALVARAGRIDDQSDRECPSGYAFVVISETLQGQQANIYRNDLLNWLSSLNFIEKQEDVFTKCHPGTGQWLVMTTEFQAWFAGNQSSTLWCAGIRT